MTVDVHDELTRLYGVRTRIERDITRCEAELARQQAERTAARFAARKAAREAAAANKHRVLAEARFDEGTQIVLLVADTMNVPETFLTDKSRRQELADARAVAFFVARSLGWSYPRIGDWAERDHTTAMHGCRKVQQRADLIDHAAQVRANLRSDAA